MSSSAELNVFVFQAPHDLGDFQIQNLHQIRLGERTEDDDIVEPVQEFGLEGALGLVHDFFLHPLIAVLIA